MESLDPALLEIAKSIQSLQNTSIFDDVLATIPAALIASIAAIVAAWATNYYQNKSIKDNVIDAVHLEISIFRKEIERILALVAESDARNCLIVKNASTVSYVYINNTRYISMLNSEVSHLIFDFYTSLMSVPPAKIEDCFFTRDLELLVKKADLALKGIESVRKRSK
jgi:hypothetical protein